MKHVQTHIPLIIGISLVFLCLTLQLGCQQDAQPNHQAESLSQEPIALTPAPAVRESREAGSLIYNEDMPTDRLIHTESQILEHKKTDSSSLTKARELADLKNQLNMGFSDPAQCEGLRGEVDRMNKAIQDLETRLKETKDEQDQSSLSSEIKERRRRVEDFKKQYDCDWSSKQVESPFLEQSPTLAPSATLAPAPVPRESHSSASLILNENLSPDRELRAEPEMPNNPSSAPCDEWDREIATMNTRMRDMEARLKELEEVEERSIVAFKIEKFKRRIEDLKKRKKRADCE